MVHGRICYACKTFETIRDTCWKTNHPVETYVTRKNAHEREHSADVGEIKNRRDTVQITFYSRCNNKQHLACSL